MSLATAIIYGTQASAAAFCERRLSVHEVLFMLGLICGLLLSVCCEDDDQESDDA